MHRIDGLYYITVGGKRWFDLGPPGTQVTEHIQNALQEEIADVIETAGITLRATGAIDAISNYKGQLLAALQYHIANETAPSNFSFGVDVTSTYFDSPASDVQFKWWIKDGLVHIFIEQILGDKASGGGASLVLTPHGGTWSNLIIPDQAMSLPISLQTDADDMIGRIIIPVSDTAGWQLFAPNASSVLGAGNFPNGSSKGIRRQMITYPAPVPVVP